MEDTEAVAKLLFLVKVSDNGKKVPCDRLIAAYM